MDMDPYGHLNNVVHYSLFDSLVNAWLIERGALDVGRGEVIGLVVENGCHYFAPLTYPDPVIAALRVGHLGRSSVRYEIGLFAPHSDAAAAQGHFVHVYVDRASRRPVTLPESFRAALAPLL
jgi:acyl-CoA thioester hydrolase